MGKKFSEETRRKIGEASKGRKQSQETIEKRRQCRLGFKMTEESKANLSKSREKYRYEITLPNKEKVISTNLSKFCKENNLTQALMLLVMNGKRTHHKQHTVIKLGEI